MDMGETGRAAGLRSKIEGWIDRRRHWKTIEKRPEQPGDRELANVLSLTAVVTLWACNAQVLAFEASQHHVCAGERVELTWDVKGTAHISIMPPVPGAPQGDVESKGRMSIEPQQSTRVELHATRFLGNPTTSVQEIDVRTAPDKPELLAAAVAGTGAGCADGKVWATLRATRFAPTVLVQTVSSNPADHRSYSVEHVGVHAQLTPGTALSDFAGLPIAGDWVLTSPLGTAEICGPNLPHNLTIDVFTRCTSGGDP